MERDFLGLGTRNAPMKVKEETVEISDSGPMRGSEMQWSFSNNLSTMPQYLSFKAAEEERPRKTAHDHLASSGVTAKSSADCYASNSRQYSSAVQKNMIIVKQGGNHHVVNSYGMQKFDASPASNFQDAGIPSISNQPNQAIKLPISSSVHHPQFHLGSNRQGIVGNKGIPQPLGGAPIMASPLSVVPASGPVVGTTDLRSTPKTSTGPSQLTIFYNGSVCVYDDVSPEKAQAIMLLAGNGTSSTPQNKMTPMAQTPPPVPRPVSAEGFVGKNQPATTSFSSLTSPMAQTTLPIPRTVSADGFTGKNFPATSSYSSLTSSMAQTPPPIPRPVSADCFSGRNLAATSSFSSLTSPMAQTPPPIPRPVSADGFVGRNLPTTSYSSLASPISITSHAYLQRGSGSNSTNEITIVKPIVAPLASPVRQQEPPKNVTSVGSTPPSLNPAVAVPQARKASLARFLEKRKERATSSMPYDISKKSSDCSTTLSSEGISFSITSAGSNSLQAIH